MHEIVNELAHEQPKHADDVAGIKDYYAPEEYFKGIRNNQNRANMILAMPAPRKLLINLTLGNNMLRKLLFDELHHEFMIQHREPFLEPHELEEVEVALTSFGQSQELDWEDGDEVDFEVSLEVPLSYHRVTPDFLRLVLGDVRFKKLQDHEN